MRRRKESRFLLTLVCTTDTACRIIALRSTEASSQIQEPNKLQKKPVLFRILKKIRFHLETDLQYFVASVEEWNIFWSSGKPLLDMEMIGLNKCRVQIIHTGASQHQAQENSVLSAGVSLKLYTGH